MKVHASSIRNVNIIFAMFQHFLQILLFKSKRTWTFFVERPELVRKLIVVFAPYLLILTSGLDWMFANHTLDPYHYSGIFLNYADPGFHEWNYKHARLPWILSGYLLFSIFNFKVATILLIGTYFSSALLGVYIFMRNMLGASIAFVFAVALGFFPQFHMLHSGGAYYHNLSSATFLIWSFAILSMAFKNKEKAPRYLFYSGIFAALAFHCNITVINFFPIFIGLLWLMNPSKPIKPIIKKLTLFVCGALIITLGLILISWIVRGQPFFFANVFRLVKHALRDPNFQKTWWESWGSLWFFSKYKLHVLLLACVYFGASGFSPFKRKWNFALNTKEGRFALFCIAQYIYIFTAWLLWQTEGQTALNIDYFSYPLIIPCFICLGGLLYISSKGSFTINPQWYLIIPALFLGILISGLGPKLNLIPMGYLYLAGSLIIFLLLFTKKTWALVSWFMVFALACSINNDALLYNLPNRTKAAHGKNYTLAVLKGQEYVSEIAQWNNLRVFYFTSETINDQNGAYLGSHPSSILNLWYPITNVWANDDSLSEEHVYSSIIEDMVNNQKYLVVITKNNDAYTRLKELFLNYNGELVEHGNYPIEINGGSFNIKSFKVSKIQKS